MQLEQTNNLLSLDIISQSTTEQETWLKDIGSLLTQWYELENFALMGQCRILYTVSENWNGLADEATSHWNYNFLQWAKSYTRTNSNEPRESTIQNKIRVYRYWIAEETIEYPRYIEIPATNEYGQETDQKQKVEINPIECNYSKLLIANKKAKAGQMTKEDWQNLVNPTVSTRKFEFELNNSKTIEQVDDFRIYELDGILYAYENGEKAALMMTLMEDSGSDLFNRGLNYIYSTCRIKANSL